jgi:hypothetical protein
MVPTIRRINGAVYAVCCIEENITEKMLFKVIHTAK